MLGISTIEINIKEMGKRAFRLLQKESAARAGKTDCSLQADQKGDCDNQTSIFSRQ
ncbi:hypothetical protein PO124_06825 [Bacillus licheniformis]|nr:hypothetical protein [Bacillus licheniformis]